MTNKELQEYLKQYPDDLDIKLVQDLKNWKEIIPLTQENILYTSETAFINTDAPEEEWNHEDGRIDLGNGKRYLLFNPLIV